MYFDGSATVRGCGTEVRRYPELLSKIFTGRNSSLIIKVHLCLFVVYAQVDAAGAVDI